MNEYSAASGSFTATRSGLYAFEFGAITAGNLGSGNTYASICLKTPHREYFAAYSNGGLSSKMFQGSGAVTVFLKSGETVGIILNVSGSSKNIGVGAYLSTTPDHAFCYFKGRKVY